MSIDQYEQILDEEEIKAENKVKEYNKENRKFWRLAEDGPEILRIKDILLNNLDEKSFKPRRNSCFAKTYSENPIFYKDSEDIEIAKGFLQDAE